MDFGAIKFLFLSLARSWYLTIPALAVLLVIVWYRRRREQTPTVWVRLADLTEPELYFDHGLRAWSAYLPRSWSANPDQIRQIYLEWSEDEDALEVSEFEGITYLIFPEDHDESDVENFLEYLWEETVAT